MMLETTEQQPAIPKHKDMCLSQSHMAQFDQRVMTGKHLPLYFQSKYLTDVMHIYFWQVILHYFCFGELMKRMSKASGTTHQFAAWWQQTPLPQWV